MTRLAFCDFILCANEAKLLTQQTAAAMRYWLDNPSSPRDVADGAVRQHSFLIIFLRLAGSPTPPAGFPRTRFAGLFTHIPPMLMFLIHRRTPPPLLAPPVPFRSPFLIRRMVVQVAPALS